jgi:hypothetical protein
LKKRTKKLLSIWFRYAGDIAYTRGAKGIKVFCFFFSKKKCFLTSPAPAVHFLQDKQAYNPSRPRQQHDLSRLVRAIGQHLMRGTRRGQWQGLADTRLQRAITEQGRKPREA